VIEAEGLVVTPGLVDPHVHVWWGVAHLAIEADGNERAGNQLLLPIETLAKGRRFNPQHSVHPKLVGHPHKQ